MISCRNIKPIRRQHDNFAKIFADIRLALSNVASESNEIISSRSDIESTLAMIEAY